VSSSETITTSSLLGTVLVGCSKTARETSALVVVSPSSTAVIGTGGDGAIDASTAATAAGTSEGHVWFEDRWMVASLCDE
jgi:hypothetical protein